MEQVCLLVSVEILKNNSYRKKIYDIFISNVYDRKLNDEANYTKISAFLGIVKIKHRKMKTKRNCMENLTNVIVGEQNWGNRDVILLVLEQL